MNCTEVTERIAAFLDGQVSPAESEHIAEHLERCTLCHQLCDALMRQDFEPLSQEEKDAVCGSGGFWDSMDASLESELASMQPDESARSRRTGGVPLSMGLAYAAALLLAVAWGYQHMQRADHAEATAKELQQLLEQERRLAAEPEVVPQVPYRPVSYTPRRATF